MRVPGYGANQGTFLVQVGKPLTFGIGDAGGWSRKYRLTILFAATAVLVITIATVAVNHVIGNLAEGNLIRSAEETTIRDAEHIQAIQLAGEKPFALIFMDIKTPGINGVDACREIKRVSPSTVVVMMTDFSVGELIRPPRKKEPTLLSPNPLTPGS